MNKTSSRLSQIQLVMVPSSDQERSLAFYEAVGFERRNDIPWGEGYRWVEVYPPGGNTGIALIPRRPGEAAGVTTGIILHTDDIDATHAAMRSSGVDVDDGIARKGSPTKIRLGANEMAEPSPPMFWFRDPDGNSLLIVEIRRPVSP
ncbi:MAG: VOC family protein [Candidatus Eremiobacteraeota bacterium]|nr:VOC family protein [Candidatus Eremiobacteraeota bacterium]